MKSSAKMGIVGILLLGVALSVLLFGQTVRSDPGDPVGIEYNSSSDVYHIWNEVDNYYIDASSGIQLTNHYQDYWSHNTVCFHLFTGSWQEYCVDSASWDWVTDTNDETYVNLTGTTSISIGGLKADIILEYYIESDDTHITIRPTFIANSKGITDSKFEVRVYNVKIDSTYEYDWIEVFTDPITTLNMSDPSLNQSWQEGELDQLKINMFDNISGSAMDILWDDNITLNGVKTDKNSYIVINHTTEPNALAEIIYETGTVSKGDVITLKYLWHDAAPVRDQTGYRWCKDDNAEPDTCWATENVNITGVNVTDEFRLRIQLGVTVATLRNDYFSVYYRNATDGEWKFPSASCTGAEFCFHDGQATEDDTVTEYKITNSNVPEHYAESNPSAAMDSIAAGSYGEWDFAIKPGATLQTGNKYEFMLVEVTSGGAFNANMSSYVKWIGLTTRDAGPTFGTPETNNTDIFIGDFVNHSVTIDDDINLTSYKVEWNASGVSCDTWENSSVYEIDGTTISFIASNISLIPDGCAGKTIGYRFHANDSLNQWNTSSTQSYSVSKHGYLEIVWADGSDIESTICTSESPCDWANTTNKVLNATITCQGGAGSKCGEINSYVRYNESTSIDTHISTEIDTTPFYLYVNIYDEVMSHGYYEASLAVDSTGTVHTILENDTNVYCNNSGGIWGCEQFTTDIVDDYAIAVDSGDVVHISYRNQTSPSPQNLSYCNNTGGTWSCENVEGDDTNDFGEGSSIAIGTDDTIYITHFEDSANDPRCCNNTGGSWNCEDIETNSNEGDMSVAVDSNDIVHVLHKESSNPRYCNNSGGSWGCEYVFEGVDNLGGQPTIAIDSNNAVHMAFANITSPYSLVYCNNTIGSWTCSILETGRNPKYIGIGIDENDMPHIGHSGGENNIERYCYMDNVSLAWKCYSFVNYSTVWIGYAESDSLATRMGRLSTTTSFLDRIYYVWTDSYAEESHLTQLSPAKNPIFLGTLTNDESVVVNFTVNMNDNSSIRALEITVNSTYTQVLGNDTADAHVGRLPPSGAATDATFSIAMPSDYTSWTAIAGTSEGAATATDDISFNFTDIPENEREPYQGGDDATAQNGAEQPIFRIDSTGNVAIDISLRFSSAPLAGVTVSSNGTCEGTFTSCEATAQEISTSYVLIVDELSQTDSYANLTMYANLSAGTADGVSAPYTLYIKGDAD
ncbi:hypothetical protein ACFL6S_03410 [Candidatus Poribacteria bacterium]